MRLQVLATGSDGNCYALHAGMATLILDAGIPLQRIVAGIEDFTAIAGCVLTHEHQDHIKGAAGLMQRGIQTVCSEGTRRVFGDMVLTTLNAIPALQQTSLGGFTILPFRTQHDAAEPFGYVVRYEQTGETALYATDTYYLRNTFPGINFWIVECNFADEIANAELADGEINAELRNRLNRSHMSLRRLLDTLAANDLSATRKIVLVHLSDERSDEARMVEIIERATGIETVAATAGTTIDLNMTPF